jgi:ketosteroid isomerase-like protein
MTTQTKSSPVNSTAIREINDAVEQLRLQMINPDGAILDQLTSDDLTYGHSNGHIQSKQEFIVSFTGGDSVFLNIELSGQTAQVIGNTAIVRHVLSAATNDRGKGPATVKISILLVWMKNEGGKWQLVARQAVKVL